MSDVKGVFDCFKFNIVFYVGGMGYKIKNFYNEMMICCGYGDVVVCI